jgi:hypothetical protein
MAMISTICLSLGFGTPALSQEESKPEEKTQETKDSVSEDKDAKEKEPSKKKKKRKKKKSSSKGKKKKRGRPGKIRGEIKAQDIGNSRSYCFFDKKGEMVQCGKVIRHKSKKEKYKLREFRKPSEERKLTPELGAPGGGSAGGARMWALYNPAIITPVSYNRLVYADNEPQDLRGTLWSPKETIEEGYFSFGMQVSIPLSKSLSLLPGFRYRVMSAFEGESNYDEATIFEENDEGGFRQQQVFSSISQKASSLGFWLDVEYLRLKFGKDASLFLTGGADLDLSTLDFRAIRVDEGEELPTTVLAEGTSETTIFSLRTGVGFDYLVYNSFGLHTGINMLIPIYATDPTFEGEVNDFNTEFLETDPQEDLQSQLGHGKSSFGIEITFGIVQEL